ncbi:MAG: hypothetical protein QNK04_12680 [Myxococcota bacterium]|nr:hypothetical protein [Myxococcota bacterium]
MARKVAEYAKVRGHMQPGDVIAFGGKGHFSEVIKWSTRSVVSHVGVILQTSRLRANAEGFFNQIIESTSLDGFNGVIVSKLSRRLEKYPGEIWWLPLSQAARGRFDEDQFFDFLVEQAGKEYDLPQAIKSALDSLGSLTRNEEDFARFFCSELVAAALEVAGATPSVNASEVTPIDLCRWSLYEPDYYQLKGDSKSIRGYNSLNPASWSEG